MTKVITVAAVCLTVPLACMCAAIPLGLPHLLTADPKVAACMRSLAPIAAASILACTLDVACEGLLVRAHSSFPSSLILWLPSVFSIVAETPLFLASQPCTLRHLFMQIASCLACLAAPGPRKRAVEVWGRCPARVALVL